MDVSCFVMTLGVFVLIAFRAVFLMGAILSLAIISSMQKAGISVAAKAKESQNAANGKVVEYLHGLSIYKLFPGSRQQSVNIEKVFGDLRDASFNMEKTFIRKNLSYTLVIRLFCGIITILNSPSCFWWADGNCKGSGTSYCHFCTLSAAGKFGEYQRNGAYDGGVAEKDREDEKDAGYGRRKSNAASI